MNIFQEPHRKLTNSLAAKFLNLYRHKYAKIDYIFILTACGHY